MKEWLTNLINTIADFLGLGFDLTMWLCVGAIALLLIIIIAIAVGVSSKKRKKAAEKTAVSTASTPTTPAPVKEPEQVAEKEPEQAKSLPKEEKEPVVEPVKEEPKEKPKTTVRTTKANAEKQTEKPASKAATEKPAAKPVKKAATTASDKEDKKPAAKNGKAKALGKWTVQRKSEDEYISELAASNGEVMLTSETYVSEDGARKGIATIIKAVENGEFVMHKTKNGMFYFKLKSASNRLLCAGEMYKDKAGCAGAIESVKRIAAESPVSEEIAEGEKYLDYTPVKLTDKDIEKSAAGKWKIETTEDGKFYSTLYASNGQVMLSTEEVATKASAVSAINNVKKNSLAGNFVIDKDKFGKFYYKLRNAQKSVICIGESYATSDRCISALESVRKFAANSPIVEQTESNEAK